MFDSSAREVDYNGTWWVVVVVVVVFVVVVVIVVMVCCVLWNCIFFIYLNRSKNSIFAEKW